MQFPKKHIYYFQSTKMNVRVGQYDCQWQTVSLVTLIFVKLRLGMETCFNKGFNTLAIQASILARE